MNRVVAKLAFVIIAALASGNLYFISRLVNRIEGMNDSVVALTTATAAMPEVVRDVGDLKSRLAVLEYAFGALKSELEGSRTASRKDSKHGR